MTVYLYFFFQDFYSFSFCISINPFCVNYHVGCEEGDQIPFANGYSVVLAIFIDNMIVFPLNSVDTLVEKQLTVYGFINL